MRSGPSPGALIGRGHSDIEYGLPHRVAHMFGRHTLGQFGRPGAAGHHRHAAGEKLVHPAQHPVLFVDQTRQAEDPAAAIAGIEG